VHAAEHGLVIGRIDHGELELLAAPAPGLLGGEVGARIGFGVRAHMGPREPLCERVGERHQPAAHVALAPRTQGDRFVGEWRIGKLKHARYPRRVADLGDPTSYLELADGVPVFSSDGERVGVVEHVLADEDTDIFDGLVIDSRIGPGGHRFADATQVADLYERGVVLALDAAASRRLPEPSGSPAVMEADPDDTAPDDLGDKLKRAWNRISGNY
jgi:hypothetical protein